MLLGQGGDFGLENTLDHSEAKLTDLGLFLRRFMLFQSGRISGVWTHNSSELKYAL